MVKTFYCEDNSINLILNKIEDKVKGALQPSCILMAGSFGKEAWLFSDNQLLSDFEIVFICEKPWSMTTKNRIQAELNKELNVEISLKGYLSSKVQAKVLSNYSRKNPGYLSLDFFDALSEPLFLSAPTTDLSLPQLSVKDVPHWEAWRLLVNRSAELIEQRQTKNELSIRYGMMKSCEALGDAWLLVNQLYKKNINSRKEIWDHLKDSNELPESFRSMYDHIRLAYESRRSHDLTLFDIEANTEPIIDHLKSGMMYLQGLINKELGFSSNEDFYHNYQNSYLIQSSFLEFDLGPKALLSNGLRLLKSRSFVFKNLRLSSITRSWRHMILLTISSYIAEYDDQAKKRTRATLKTLIKEDPDSFDEALLEKHLITLWKKLR